MMGTSGSKKIVERLVGTRAFFVREEEIINQRMA